MTDLDTELEIDWGVGAELIGASPMQVRFVQGICDGLSQTASARQAGYAGTDAALRGAASRLAKGNKVRALLAWAKAGGAGPSDAPGSVDELKKILWRHARGADKNHSIKATEVLHRLAAQERAEAAAGEERFEDPTKLIRELAAVNPARAAAIAISREIPWQVPRAAIDETVARLEEMKQNLLKFAAMNKADTATVATADREEADEPQAATG